MQPQQDAPGLRDETRVAASPPRPKFSDPRRTARGELRAVVPFAGWDTLWINTGTLCNVTCVNCYIESSPSNDRLVWLTRAEARTFLDEAAALDAPPREIGITGGEPFMAPDIVGIMDDALTRGFRVLVLTNAMKPLHHRKAGLQDLQARFPGALTLRVSLDHYSADGHERLRGPNTFAPALDGLAWLAQHGFDIAVAGRTPWPEPETDLRRGFGTLFARHQLPIDAGDPARLVLFPEMSPLEDPPEISEGCWAILHKSPRDVMCASSRMVVKRKGAAAPAVVACTLLPYEPEFELGANLSAAARPVALNHSHCASFCVLGGASCSPRK